ncbi:MAG: Hpt domain-containing protein [Planctomycetota bacterium]|nr:Hpt domain-containing protein [Planctomycetota bacterium]MDA1178062.1 Hpt domain-containing protein [Planctomycetota bacterium]
MFRRDSSRAMEELAQALIEERKQQAQLIAHRLEGQLGNFEARAAVETAARLAGAVAEGDYAAAGARHAELAAEIRRLEETLRDWRAETL